MNTHVLITVEQLQDSLLEAMRYGISFGSSLEYSAGRDMTTCCLDKAEHMASTLEKYCGHSAEWTDDQILDLAEKGLSPNFSDVLTFARALLTGRENL